MSWVLTPTSFIFAPAPRWFLPSSLYLESHFHIFYFMIFYVLKVSSFLKSLVSKSYVTRYNKIHSFTVMPNSSFYPHQPSSESPNLHPLFPPAVVPRGLLTTAGPPGTRDEDREREQGGGQGQQAGGRG